MLSFSSSRDNTTTTNNELLTSVYKSCINYSRNICASAGERNCSEKSLQCSEDEIKRILNADSFAKYDLTCKKSLGKTLKKYLSCRNTSHGREAAECQLVNETTTVCATCVKFYHMTNNFSLREEIHNWLKNLNCIGIKSTPG